VFLVFCFVFAGSTQVAAFPIADVVREDYEQAGPGSPEQQPPSTVGHSGPSDQALTFLLVAVGFFLLSVMWHLYVRRGWDRDGAKQVDFDATRAMQRQVDMEMEVEPNSSTAGGGSKKSKSDRAPRGARGAGGWLGAANNATAE
jgi:hypothetical protein